MAVVVKVPGWVAYTALAEHEKVCDDCRNQAECRNSLYAETLRNAIAVATQCETEQAREWRAKGFPRDV